MTNKKSLKSGLVFSAAVAGSILGNYHRAYSACARQTIGGGEIFACEGGNITINNSIDDANTGVDSINVTNVITLDGDVGTRDTNTVSITVGSDALNATPIRIQTENASGIWFYNELTDGNQYVARGINEARNLILNIGANVSIDTTSDGNRAPYGFKEAVSINNSSAHGSNTVVINGDIVTRGVGANFDHAISLYQLGEGDTDFTVGETSDIKAYNGGVGLKSYGLGKAIFNISGDVYSQQAQAVHITSSNTPYSPHNTDINLTITSTSTIRGASNAIYLGTFEGNLDSNQITVTISGDATSTNASALRINGSARVGNQDTININSGAHLTGATSAIFVEDTTAIINLTGGANFSSTDDADIVRLTGTGNAPIAIRLPGSITGGNEANNEVNISGNVIITGDVIGGEDDGDNDEINFNAANLTLSNSDITQFENLVVTENSVISLTNGSSIVGSVVANTNKTLALTLNASSLDGDGGNAVTFGTGNDSLTISGTSAITGNVNGGDGEDSFIINGGENMSLTDFTLSNFENISVSNLNSVNGAFRISSSDILLEGVGDDATLFAFGGISGVDGNSTNLTVKDLVVSTSSQNLITFANQNDNLEIQGEVTFGASNGTISGGDGEDSLILNNTNLNLGNVEFENFENFEIHGENIVNGNIDLGNMTVQTGNGSTTLEMNGALTSPNPLELPSNFTLNGNFTINGNLIATAGSTISPGSINSGVGAGVVNGNLTFEPGSTLIIDVDGEEFDIISVNGVLDIADGANLSISTLNAPSRSARIISAESISGRFNIVNSGSNISFLYSNNGLDLNYVSLNTNALSAQIQSSVDSSILFSDTLNKQIARGAFEKGRNFWMRNIYRDRDIDSSSTQTGFNERSQGVAFGGETDLNESVRLGFSAGHIDSNLNVSDAQGGKDGNSYFAATYANYKTTNNLFASLALTLGYHDNKNSRLVNNDGVQSYAKSNSQDKEIGLNFQTGKKFTLKNLWNVTPRFSASYIRIMADSIKESRENAGDSAVSIKSHDFSTLKFRESVRLERANFFKISKFEFSPYLEVGLSQERGVGDRKISGSFLAANQEFTANLKKTSRNFVTGTAGFNMQINKDVSAFVSYENAVSSQETRNDFNAGFSIKF